METYPRALLVEQVLQQVGILRMLGLSERRSPDAFPDNVRHWRYATGELADGEAVEPIVTAYDGILAPSLRTGLYAGIVEAMTNSKQHAYLGIRPDNLPGHVGSGCRSWWMFSQEKDGELTVAFCDLGIGMPVSLNESKKWNPELVQRLLAARAWWPRRMHR